jgi:hypothetical protein
MSLKIKIIIRYMSAKLNGKGSKLQKKKEDLFFPSDKDIRKDVKA